MEQLPTVPRIEVLVLGSGSAIPMTGGTNSSYLVRAGETTLLIDCGPAILQQLDAVGISPKEVTHVYITHRHGDHTLGYPLFLLWWITHQRDSGSFPVTITGRLTWSSLGTLLQHTFGEVSRQATSVPRVLFPDEEPFTHEMRPGLRLRTWPMQHSSFAPVSGLRLEIDGRILAFTGDTAPCPNIASLARDADLLFHEAAYCATLDPDLHDGRHGHSTARGAAQGAATANARRLALVHLSARYQGRQVDLIAEAAREFPGEVTAPSGGAVYSL